MVKVTKKNRPSLQKKRDNSALDSEIEFQRPKKLIKTNQKGILSSTPHPNSASFLDGPSTSTAKRRSRIDTARSEDNSSDCNYADFTSLAESFSLVSEDEDDLPTVSRLAEQRPSTPVQNDTSQRSVACLNNSFPNASTEISLDTLKVLKQPVKHLEVIALQHPSSLTLHGNLRMTVLVGTVSILGYDVKTGKKPVDIFSSKRFGYRKITTKQAVVRIDPQSLQKTLQSLLEFEEKSIEIIKEFVDCIGSFTSVVVLEKRLLSPSLQFLELYLPNAVEMDLPKKKTSPSDMYSNIESGVIEVSQDAERIADELNKEFLETGPRIIVHGAKQSGKSTMLRYLVHAALNLQSEVYYLDADPGQTEFTPPGVVSLVKVTSPMLGPPHTHLRIPVKMIFTGSITPATSPPMYTKCVCTLIEYFNANFSQNVLFVNTTGWVDGIGDVLFQSIKNTLKPNMVIDFLSSEECTDLKIENTQENCINVQLPIKKYLGLSYSPKDMREFTLMAHLGRCQKYYMKPQYVNEFRPVGVNWDKIALAVLGKRVQPNRLIQAIHCSIVALCHVDESLMLESDNPEFPRTLEDEAINECLGYGLVRTSDETKHIYYIVTPLSMDTLMQVNALVKGDILIPDVVFLKQPIYNVPLPYTMESKVPPASMEKSVKKRKFIPQQTPKNR